MSRIITYKKACEVIKKVRSEECPKCKYANAVEIDDRWAFTFSIFHPDDKHTMTPAPSFFVFKEDGHVEPFCIPPLENLYLIRSGKKVEFIE